MSANLWILLIVTVFLVLAAAALSKDDVRDKLLRANGGRSALVPLFAAFVLWIAAIASDFLKNRIEDVTVPSDVLAFFVEKISFGFPVISMEFFERDFTTAEKRRELAALRTSDDPVGLSASELARLNDISHLSGQLDDIDPTRALTTKAIASALTQPLNYGFDYGQWAAAAQSWSEFLRQGATQTGRAKAIDSFSSKVREVNTAAGLFQGIVGMAARQVIVIPAVKGECEKVPLKVARLEPHDGKYFLNFPLFRSYLGAVDGRQDVVAAIKALGALFEAGCIDLLADTFAAVSEVYRQERVLMRRYIEEWNRILSSKEAETIVIRVAVANVGKFDSFIRRQAKVAVGPKGGDKITFVVEMRESGNSGDPEKKDAEESKSEYFQIKSRGTASMTIQARLAQDVQKKVYGAFQSEQTLLRMAFLASAGAGEDEVFTPTVPFSAKAESMSKDRIQSIKIDF